MDHYPREYDYKFEEICRALREIRKEIKELRVELSLVTAEKEYKQTSWSSER